ncbi:MAG: DUF2283 domain-containing protein [Gammaproteobacteria bacterium]|jgi:uncharacterized protein YuzE
MKLNYFKDTDTLYIEFNDQLANETMQLDENTLLEVDEFSNIVALTIEHASKRTDLDKLSISGIAA